MAVILVSDPSPPDVRSTSATSFFWEVLMELKNPTFFLEIGPSEVRGAPKTTGFLATAPLLGVAAVDGSGG